MLKTNQLMVRELDGYKINQRTKDKYFNATDVLKLFNEKNNTEKRFKDFWENKNTKVFCEALKSEILNRENSAHLEIAETTRGKNGSTWMHPYLFIKFCFWLSPEFEVKVIKWVYDNLIDFRHQAGDYYKDMCKAISETYKEWYGKDPDPLIFVKEARILNTLVFNNPNAERNEATQEQLDLMNRLQKLNISLINNKVGKDNRYKKLYEFKEMYVNSK